jgi:hypothetical protein
MSGAPNPNKYRGSRNVATAEKWGSNAMVRPLDSQSGSVDHLNTTVSVRLYHVTPTFKIGVENSDYLVFRPNASDVKMM